MSLLSLPDELLEHILLSEGIRANDICSVSKSCRRGREAVLRSAAIWRRLFTTHFPSIAHQLEDEVQGDPHDFWRHLFIARYSIDSHVRDFIKDLSPKHYSKQSLSNIHMEAVLKLPFASESKGALLVDSLLNVVNGGDLDQDLTNRFYGGQVARFARQQSLAEKWRQFKSLQPDDQDYYQGLVYFSQWFQPFEQIDVARVKADVLFIALSAVEKLQVLNPDHPFFNKDNGDNAGDVKGNLLDFDVQLEQDRYNAKHSLQILDAINEAMFKEMGFRGNTAYYNNPSNSFIDKVLQSRQGIPITLCVLHSLVAKKLGVKLDPVNFPRHFLLKWHNQNAASHNSEVLYIDSFASGKRLRADEAHEISENVSFKLATPMEVFQRMTRNLVHAGQMQEQEQFTLSNTSTSLLRSSLELTQIIGADFEYPGLAICQMYLQMNINHREIMAELDNHQSWPANIWMAENQQMLMNQIRGLRRICMAQLHDENEDKDDEDAENTREVFEETHDQEKLKDFGCYSIGMIMKHRRYNYLCVIFGWDPICRATMQWIHQMGVNKLPKKDKQPFYNVLVEDGSIRYAADENLELVKPRRIEHPLVGKYFKTFHSDIGYEANEELAKQYPEDKTVREQEYVKFNKIPRSHNSSTSSNSSDSP